MNREYAIALQFVRVKYAHLYRLAAAVVLTPADMFPTGQLGQCSSDNFVNVKDEPRPVSEFVDTLVHELTHCKQNTEGYPRGGNAREEQAYEAGIQAAKEYMREAAPWMRK